MYNIRKVQDLDFLFRARTRVIQAAFLTLQILSPDYLISPVKLNRVSLEGFIT